MRLEELINDPDVSAPIVGRRFVNEFFQCNGARMRLPSLIWVDPTAFNKLRAHFAGAIDPLPFVGFTVSGIKVLQR